MTCRGDQLFAGDRLGRGWRPPVGPGRRSSVLFGPNAEAGHITGEALVLAGRIEPVILETGATPTIAAIGICRHPATNAGRGVRIENLPEMSVEPRHCSHRVVYQVGVMNVEYRLGEALFVRGGDHQPGRRKPALAVLAPDFDPVDATTEGTPKHLGQPRDGREHRYRVTMYEHQIGIGIDGADRAEREDMVGAFQYPAPPTTA